MQLQNSRIDRDISLPGQSSKSLLYLWSIQSSAHRPIASRRLFHEAQTSKIVPPVLAVCQSHSSVFCRMSRRLFHEAGTLKDRLPSAGIIGLHHQCLAQDFFVIICSLSLFSSYTVRGSLTWLAWNALCRFSWPQIIETVFCLPSARITGI